MWCIINLPNGTQQAIKWDPKSIGQDCLEKICQSLGIICEMEYFGLEHWNPDQANLRTRQWINLRNRLSHDNSSGIPLMLALRVKFWVPVHFLLQEKVRNLFYMQAKADLLEGRLSARDWANAAKLSALICQADGMHFNKRVLEKISATRLKHEHNILLQQQQVTQQQTQQKDGKEKEHVLLLKKRRLSKQKSLDSVDSTCQNSKVKPRLYYSSTLAEIPSSNIASALSNLNSSVGLRLSQGNISTEADNAISLLSIYQDYIVRPADGFEVPMPEDFLKQVATEHGKLSLLKMTPKSAQYWLLQEIEHLHGYGEEVFNGFTTGENSKRCDISVGAHGITVIKNDTQESIRFSTILAAKSFRRIFQLEYVDCHNECCQLEIKLPKHSLAAGLYRSITERHAFYVCDKVRGVVTNQFTRDLKGTIASMFKEDTELGKRYVFDIQHTCREVHDQARRVLYERGIEVTAPALSGSDFDEILQNNRRSCYDPDISTRVPQARDLDEVLQEKKQFEDAVERCVETRISEAMTCNICMDNQINSVFSPCYHVIACMQCAARCSNCPNCRAEVTSFMKIYLPTELRANHCEKNNNDTECTVQSKKTLKTLSGEELDKTNNCLLAQGSSIQISELEI